MDCQLWLIIVTSGMQRGIPASWPGLGGSACQLSHSYLLKDLSELVSLVPGRVESRPHDLVRTGDLLLY